MIGGADLDLPEVLQALAVDLPQLEPRVDLPVAGIEPVQAHAAEGELEDLRHVFGGQPGAPRLVAVDHDLDLVPPLVEGRVDVLDSVDRPQPAHRLVRQLGENGAVVPEEFHGEIGAVAATFRLVGEEDARAGDLRHAGADRLAQLLHLVVAEVLP